MKNSKEVQTLLSSLNSLYDKNDDGDFSDDVEKFELKSSQLASKRLKAELDQFIDIGEFRRLWSNVLLYIVIGICVFEVILVLAVGTETLKFKDEWFLRIVIGGSFTQILILPKIVADFLFSDKSYNNGKS